MHHAWFVRPMFDDQNMMDYFRKFNIVATKVQGKNLDLDRETSIGLSGKTVEEIREALSKEPYKLSDLALGNTGLALDIFVNQMEAGDLVLVPDRASISFARIESEYQYEGDLPHPRNMLLHPWMSHQRKVLWLENIARNQLSAELRKALKNHRSVGDLTKFYAEIEARSQGSEYKPVKKTVVVRYPLRPDFEVMYEIPSDITKTEAARLSDHFKGMFFEADKPENSIELSLEGSTEDSN